MDTPQKIDAKNFGLFEFGFDQDMSEEQLDNFLKVFPTEELVHHNIMSYRNKIGFVDMKRGELYPEVIGSVQRLRRTIAKAYDIDLVQAQPNFACNGCIDALMTYIRLEWTARKNRSLRELLTQMSLDELPETNKKVIEEKVKNELKTESSPAIIVATPTYFRYYTATESKKIDMVKIPYNDGYSYPADQIMDTISKNENIIALIICTPNNPTGIPVDDEILLRIISSIPDDKIVAIDRTCANVDPEISTKELIKKFPNKKLVVFHSLSKYYSMSHIRIGFSVFSNSDFAKEVEKMLPFGLNLEGALKTTRILSKGPLTPSKEILDRIKSNQLIMDEFKSQFKDFYITPFTSNYALMHLPKGIHSKDVSDVLLSKGIFVMPGHQTPESNSSVIRIHTGGDPASTLKMISVLKEYFKR